MLGKKACSSRSTFLVCSEKKATTSLTFKKLLSFTKFPERIALQNHFLSSFHFFVDCCRYDANFWQKGFDKK